MVKINNPRKANFQTDAVLITEYRDSNYLIRSENHGFQFDKVNLKRRYEIAKNDIENFCTEVSLLHQKDILLCFSSRLIYTKTIKDGICKWEYSQNSSIFINKIFKDDSIYFYGYFEIAKIYSPTDLRQERYNFQLVVKNTPLFLEVLEEDFDNLFFSNEEA
ncbi:hypothetical protein SAMN05192550_1121 [Flavobacterium glycines]|uniref:Uncharacterized protein n=1 Tax=Flavobacterium glycines TaxID=551990 RepID=A0A1B9DRS5_9FLAO|nr:hypothetical protein [Flavobacterium glycines]OCB72387.1 hypothetical protein FBGL_06970 [Flavobacterium glycines]GEL09862.1 hypothetical protein FGL01_06010 [Flavobacterium glycines]SDI90739.1 hypothetical protein SAMN05192550_1121 [Flavobacterium glycines]